MQQVEELNTMNSFQEGQDWKTDANTARHYKPFNAHDEMPALQIS